MAYRDSGHRVGAALVAAALVLGCAAGEPASDAEPRPPAELRASVDRPTATTGDLIVYAVEVERDAEVEVALDEPGTDIAGFRIVDLGRAPAETLPSGRILERRWYELRADLVGAYVLPALTATYSDPSGAGGDLETAEISVEVESVLPDDGSEATDIRDIKPLRRIDEGARWLLWTGLALAAAALALAAWWWWRAAASDRTAARPKRPRFRRTTWRSGSWSGCAARTSPTCGRFGATASPSRRWSGPTSKAASG